MGFHEEVEQPLPNTIDINRRYLLDKDLLLNDKNNEICKYVNTLFKDDDIKSLNIKSPYDTGKTQLIKEVIKQYNPKKILWLSYRKTLTYDIHSIFNKYVWYFCVDFFE